MKSRFWLTIGVALVLSASPAAAEEIAGLPLHVETLDEGVVRVWLGDSVSTTSIAAFATSEGVVVIDTAGIPDVDAELRRVIARELGRADFAYLINTHEHRDHTGGNSVYADCTIVGHELVEAGMQHNAERRERVLSWYRDRVTEQEQQLGVNDSGEDRAALEEELVLNRLWSTALADPQDPVPPTLTFSDRMTLVVGDTTFELSYIGGMHSASDAAVFVPEHGLLFTGDTMADVWLTDTAGCLASFSVREGIPHDFPRWLANWDRLLAERDRITRLLPGHWNGELSIEGAEARVDYVRILWDTVLSADDEGLPIESVQAELRLDTRFPKLADSPGFDPPRHHASVNEMWRVVTDQTSAARALYELLLEDDPDEAAIGEILAARDDESPTYFFSEGEINAYGYVLLQQEKTDGAVSLFEINAELYPESWNVYDSLGEALLKSGRTAEGVAMYERSLVLNPENTNGKEILDRLSETSTTL
jgi:glyoxylase-like metal-dependent hydrolase (beta-lactamase superfamily II)